MIAMLVNYTCLALQVAILVRVFYSWVDSNPYPTNDLKRALWAVTDPILDPLRRVIPPIGMLDVTPVVAIVALSILRQILVPALQGL
ncbi:MAG: YggT family protein [Anaerolineae bacterium]|jgi:YggT family protein